MRISGPRDPDADRPAHLWGLPQLLSLTALTRNSYDVWVPVRPRSNHVTQRDSSNQREAPLMQGKPRHRAIESPSKPMASKWCGMLNLAI